MKTTYEKILNRIDELEKMSDMYDEDIDMTALNEELYDLYEERDYIEALAAMDEAEVVVC